MVGHRRAPAAGALAALFVALMGCGSGGGSTPTSPSQQATVTFSYLAATALDPAIQQQFPQCANGVEHTHIHPSWRGFSRINMTAVGSNRWEVTFTDVPVGAEQRIRISDPNACDTDPNGASTQNVFANGVLLTRVVDTPGNGTEPGLAFAVSADGTITP